MKLTIVHAVEDEIRRVKYTFAKLEFYKQQGYQVYLPESIDITDSEQKLKEVVVREFSSSLVEEAKKEIASKFIKHQNVIEKYLKSLNRGFPTNVSVRLTQYGVGGSYHLPSQIIVNVRYKLDHLFNVIHEMTHLAIEDSIVKRFDLGHPEKEVLVNWLMERDAGIRGLFDEGYIPAKNKYELDVLGVAKKCGLI